MNEERRKRVAPLSPEERRAAIIAATLPLLRAEGINVSTRKIAECAGVAEGTIFRVFPDKGSLISATLAQAFDPAPTIESLRVIAGDPDIRFRIKTALRVLMRRFRDNVPLLFMLRESGLVQATLFPDARAGLTQIVQVLEDMLRQDQHRLRLPAEKVAWVLLSMVMQGSRHEALTIDDMVSVALDGVLYPGVEDADKTIAPPSAALPGTDNPGRHATADPDTGNTLSANA